MTLETLEIKFFQIEILEKFFTSPSVLGKDSADEIRPYSFTYNVGINARANMNMAFVVTDYIIHRNDENTRLASVKTACVFEFKEFNKVFTAGDDGKLNVPLDIEVLLKGTALSTTRGILFSELRGTYLHDAIFPLIDIRTQIISDREKRKAQREAENKGNSTPTSPTSSEQPS